MSTFSATHVQTLYKLRKQQQQLVRTASCVEQPTGKGWLDSDTEDGAADPLPPRDLHAPRHVRRSSNKPNFTDGGFVGSFGATACLNDTSLRLNLRGDFLSDADVL
jgi:hypothetical protein